MHILDLGYSDVANWEREKEGGGRGREGKEGREGEGGEREGAVLFSGHLMETTYLSTLMTVQVSLTNRVAEEVSNS